jgi:hypothetical protein
MNSFNLTTHSNSSTNKQQDTHILSIKESIASIEQYTKELSSDLEKKIKDKEELYKMYNNYKIDEILSVIESLEESIRISNEKLLNTQRIIWEMRGRILFNNI